MTITTTSTTNLVSLALITILLVLTSPGCASIESKSLAKPADPPATSKNVVSDFEKKRNEAQFQAAEARWQQGDNKACEELLVSLLERAPDDKPSVQLLADLYASQDRDDEALQLLNKLLTTHPDDAQLHQSLGLLYESKGDWDNAKRHFVFAAQIEPSNELFSRFLKDRSNPNGIGRRDSLEDPMKSVETDELPSSSVSASLSG